MRTLLVTVVLFLVFVSSGSFGLSPVSAAAPPGTLNLLEWAVPSSSAGLAGITVDASGRIWFSENATNRLGMLDPVASNIYEWGAPSINGRNIVTGQAAAFGGTSTRVYFAEYGSDKIAFFDNVTGTSFTNYLTEWPLTGGSKPVSVFVDGGDIWFTESGRDAIGRLSAINTPSSGTPTAQLTEWILPQLASTSGSTSCNCRPWGIYVNRTSGTTPETYVWFTELTGGTNNYGAVGRLQLSNNRLIVFDLGVSPLSGIHGPTDITVDSHGNVFWVNSVGNTISSLASNLVTYKEYTMITSGSIPAAPTTDASRNALWAVEYGSSGIAYLDLSVFVPSSFPPFSGQCTIAPATGTVAQCASPAQQSAASSPTPSTGSLGNPTVTSVAVSNRGPLSAPSGPSNGLYEYRLLSAGSAPFSAFLDTKENLWITESSSTVNKIAEIQTPPDFSLQLTSTASKTVLQGESATYSLSLAPTVGQQVPVTLSVTVPSGITASFNPSQGTPSFTSTLTLSTTTSTPPATYPMTITATSGSASHTVSISLTVQQATTTTTTSTTSTTSTACTFDYQITADQTSQTIAEGGSGSYQLHVLPTCPTATSVPVSLSVTTPTGVTAQFTVSSGTPPFGTQLNVQVSTTAPVTTSGIISVHGSAPSHTLTLTIQITPILSDFSISGPSTLSLYQSSRAEVTLSVTAIGAFNGPVSITIPTPSVSGLSGSVSQNPVTISPGSTVTTTLELVAQKGTQLGTYQVMVVGVGITPQGTVSHNLTISVSVTSGLQCLIATAAFGSEIAPEVQFLRNFRDQQIMQTFAGSNFMETFNAWYYSFSPAVAAYEYSHATTRTAIKFTLYPLIGILKFASGTYTLLGGAPETAALLAGLVASSLIGLVYMALPLSGLFWVLRRRINARFKVRAAKLFSLIFAACISGFVLAESFTLPGVMAGASSALVLTTLLAGGILPALEVVTRVGRKL